MKSKVLIAMSGGVDSSVACYLMKKAGHECIGATMKLFFDETVGISKSHSCCSVDDVIDARSVANALDIPYYVFNFSERFQEEVLDRFVDCYENGITPNPCIECNRHLKFEYLYAQCKKLGYEYVATGHYATIDRNNENGRYILRRAIDRTKDQSYVLYSMTQEQLAHTIFPLGQMTKNITREIAQTHGFINANKHDSQDICFVQDGKYYDFIEQYTKKTYPEGNFVDEHGTILGRHKGIIRYTVGQRKGLGLSLKEPLYVKKVDKERNEVVLASDASLYSRELTANNINLISVETITKPMRLLAKVRYRHTEQWATVTQPTKDTIHVVFDEPQRAITKGQAVVLYDGDVVFGGGTIISL